LAVELLAAVGEEEGAALWARAKLAKAKTVVDIEENDMADE